MLIPIVGDAKSEGVSFGHGRVGEWALSDRGAQKVDEMWVDARGVADRVLHLLKLVALA